MSLASQFQVLFLMTHAFESAGSSSHLPHHRICVSCSHCCCYFCYLYCCRCRSACDWYSVGWSSCPSVHCVVWGAEYIFAMLLQVTGNVFVAILVGNVLSIVSSWNTVSEKERMRNDGIQALMSQFRFAKDLRRRLRKWVVRHVSPYRVVFHHPFAATVAPISDCSLH